MTVDDRFFWVAFTDVELNLFLRNILMTVAVPATAGWMGRALGCIRPPFSRYC